MYVTFRVDPKIGHVRHGQPMYDGVVQLQINNAEMVSYMSCNAKIEKNNNLKGSLWMKYTTRLYVGFGLMIILVTVIIALIVGNSSEFVAPRSAS